jgi:outer membrane protein assembly factor BamC
MKIIEFSLILVLILPVVGCGSLGLRDRSNDYLLAEETEPMFIPGEISNATVGQIYPIPEISETNNDLTSFEVPRPQPASVNTFEQLVKIQSFDERRWVLINISPSELWPRLRNVLNRNRVPSARAEGSSGIIDTVWVSFNSDEESSHRFRFSIAPGIQIESTEVSVIHNQTARGEEALAAWPIVSDSDQRELDMLTLIANDLAGATDFASVSLLAQDIGGASKVEIVTPEVADPYVLMKLGYDRSWASVLYSSDRGGFTIVDKDRTAGMIFVSYTEESPEDDGFFAGWFGGDKEIIESNYRILVKTVGADVEIRIVGVSGDSLDKPESLRLLSILRSNLS